MDTHIDTIFKDKKIKRTEARESILGTLSKSSRPLSADDVYVKTEKLYASKKLSQQPDLVTVYRTLDTFEKVGLVRKVLFKDKKARYEILHEHGGHCHHAVCSSCGETEHVDDPAIEKALTLLSKKFKIVTHVNDHVLEFFGLCASCTPKTHKKK